MIRTLTALSFLALLVLVGCNKPADPPAPKTDPVVTKKPEEHGHKPGQHGGVIVQVGSDNYHAEPVFEKGGVLRLYLLDKDETKVFEIDAQPINAFVKLKGATEAEPLVLRPDPTPDDTKGKTSRFHAQLPGDFAGKPVEVTIPSLRIGNDRFRVFFESTPKDDHAMPAGVAEGEERKLYLTPAGKYTVADIKANGNKTPGEKFKGVKADHDLKPKAGDKICPITLTKANPAFTWVIAGQAYEFCCPPCIDEFVTLAKEKPDELKTPESYKKK